MPRCVVRYRATLVPRLFPVVASEQAVVRFEEWRDADRWGDPGRLRRRRLLTVEGEIGRSWMDRLTTKHPFWMLNVSDRIGPIEWAEE